VQIKNIVLSLLVCGLPAYALKNHAIETATTLSFEKIKDSFEHHNAWGLHTIIDLSDCDPALIRSKEVITEYIIALCKLIDMKRFGDPVVIHFGEEERVAGYSMFQLIETSNIAGHFANNTNNAYIDIFSCKVYDPNQAAQFTIDFFKAKKATVHIVLR